MDVTVEASMQNPYAMAQDLIEKGDLRQAAVQLEEVLKTTPDNAAAHNDLGVVQFQSGDHTAALAHLLQALRLEPTNSSYAENIIDVCHSLGMHQQASEMEELLARQRGQAERRWSNGQTNDGHRVIGSIDFDALRSQAVLDRNTLLTWYWNYHPRLRFLKALRPEAKVIDVGAGGGGLITWKEWLEPVRNDLKLYAVDMIKSDLFEHYTGYLICNLDEEVMNFEPSFFDAAVLSHVLEHIADPDRLMRELRGLLQPGGEMYVEVPTLESMDFPSRREFLNAGIPVSTVNFFDDSTHRRTFSFNELRTIAEGAGFKVVEGGRVRNRYAEDSLMIQGAAHKDEELCTYGIWSRLGFAHYVVVEAI